MNEIQKRLDGIIKSLGAMKGDEGKIKTANYELVAERLEKAKKLEKELKEADKETFDVNIFELEIKELEMPIY